jgi:hypothetical protein
MVGRLLLVEGRTFCPKNQDDLSIVRLSKFRPSWRLSGLREVKMRFLLKCKVRWAPTCLQGQECRPLTMLAVRSLLPSGSPSPVLLSSVL